MLIDTNFILSANNRVLFFQHLCHVDKNANVWGIIYFVSDCTIMTFRPLVPIVKFSGFIFVFFYLEWLFSNAFSSRTLLLREIKQESVKWDSSE